MHVYATYLDGIKMNFKGREIHYLLNLVLNSKIITKNKKMTSELPQNL